MTRLPGRVCTDPDDSSVGNLRDGFSFSTAGHALPRTTARVRRTPDRSQEMQRIACSAQGSRSILIRRHRPDSPKIGLIQTGLLIPTAEASLQDLAVARKYPVPSPSVMPHVSIQATSSRSVLSAAYGPKTSPRLTGIFRSYRRSIPTLGPALLCPRRRCLSLMLSTDLFFPLRNASFPFAG